MTSAIIKSLETNGYAVLADTISQEHMSFVRGEIDRLLQDTPTGRDDFEGYRTKRVYGLFGKTRALDGLTIHPPVIEVLDHVLGSYQLSAPAAISIGPSETEQQLHRDDALYPRTVGAEQLVVNVMWPLTEFTDKNGATRIIPQSHLWSEQRVPDDDDETTDVIVSPGSALIYLGSLWHGGGANSTDQSRIGVALHYAAGWLRAAENHTLVVPPGQASKLPKRLKELLGYNIHPPFIGNVNGRHPLKLISDESHP